MNICIIDNFDSFTFNLFEEFSKANNTLHVWRNTICPKEALEKINALSFPKLLVFSPGPGHPDEAALMNFLILKLKKTTPMFGVCLGMQAMVSAFGGKVSKAKSVVHGKARILDHDESLIFKGLPNKIHVGRYHSLAATQMPNELTAFALSDGIVMAVRHKVYPIVGIQFHPESILTTYGSKMIENVLSWAREVKK